MKKYLLLITLLSFVPAAMRAQNRKDTIKLADPTIFREGNTYYLYGTGNPNGFAVYTSTDVQTCQKHPQMALTKGDSYGDKQFWAPQLFKHNGKYYLAYAANEHIAIAVADSPLGPFVQPNHKPITEAGKQIDPFIFEDADGKLYLYHVRLQNGNRIFVAPLKDDLSDIDSTSIKECLHAEDGWENTARSQWPVSEGATVIKLGKMYYLFYSANDFRNIDYAVGYAVASSPLGPWAKYKGNPILSRNNTGQNGSGHGDIFTANDGRLYYVFHTHASNASPAGARKTAIIQLAIAQGNPAVVSVVPSTFRYLELEK